MRKRLKQVLIALAIGSAAASLSGCAWIDNQADYDLHANGGIVGHYADNIFPAPTKELAVYRAVVFLTLFSSFSSSFSHSDSDVLSIYSELDASRKDINNLAGHIMASSAATPLSACPANADTCSTHNYNEDFESDVPEFEKHMFKLVIVSVPTGEVKDVIDDLETADYLGAADKLASAGGELVWSAHRMAAIYRTEQEVYAAVLAKNGAAIKAAGDPSACGSADSLAPSAPTVAAAHAYIVKMKTCMDAIQASAADIKNFAVPKNAFDALFVLVNSSCNVLKNQISSQNSTAYDKIVNCNFVLSPNVDRPDDYYPKSTG